MGELFLWLPIQSLTAYWEQERHQKRRWLTCTQPAGP